MTRNNILRAQYRNSIKKELVRKSIHLCTAFVPSFFALDYWKTFFALTFILLVYCTSEILRMRGKAIPLFAKLTEVASRKRDENKFVLGPVTLVLGILSSALLFPPEAERIALYALAFGDGLASLSGKLFGRTHIPFTRGKTVAGSLACFFAVFISSFLVCKKTEAALAFGVVALFTEMLPLKDFDNFLIPLVIGAVAKFIL